MKRLKSRGHGLSLSDHWTTYRSLVKAGKRERQRQEVKQVIEEIEAECIRQIESEGFDDKHDDAHKSGELASAGAAYAMQAGCNISGWHGYDDGAPDLWPFEDEWWKPKGPHRDLIRAAALIVAQIRVLQRKENP
jgi:hypothetical protein